LQAQEQTQEQDGRKLIKILNADIGRMIKDPQQPGQRLIGNVQLSHEDAVMMCDSAYVYRSENRFVAYGHVVVVQKSTLLYGDTLYYDANTNIARVRGKLIRLEDSSAVLRTFNLDYNTKERLAYFFGGGTLADKENVLESDKGYYYSSSKLAKFHGTVEMRNKNYDILSDSLHYYTPTETAVFLNNTSIWHKDGYLSCKYGWYERLKDYFHFSKEAYVLSKQREMWADSIFYERTLGKSDLFGNIQMIDTAQSVLMFSDEAHLLNDPKQVIMYRQPSAAYYGNGKNRTDTTAVRDTVFLRGDTLQYITLKNPAFYKTDTLLQSDSTAIADTLLQTDSTAAVHASDTLLQPDTTLIIHASDTLLQTDSTAAVHASDTLLPTDSTMIAIADSIPQPDSTLQYMYAYRNVKVFRSNGQAVCDSLSFFLNDTLTEMYYNPILWNGNSQITSDKMRFIAQDGALHHGEFLGAAFMISAEDTAHYNQIKSRDLYAYFRNNDVYLLDALADVQTIFFFAEDSVLANIEFAESTNMKIFLTNRKVTRVRNYTTVKRKMNAIYAEPREKQRLKNFVWRDDIRPKTRYDVCRRRIRPSQRTESAAKTQPTFPITQKIDAISPKKKP
jgi:lipopolysaccharide export system protein LptA